MIAKTTSDYSNAKKCCNVHEDVCTADEVFISRKSWVDSTKCPIWHLSGTLYVHPWLSAYFLYLIKQMDIFTCYHPRTNKPLVGNRSGSPLLLHYIECIVLILSISVPELKHDINGASF